jgi:hypothetical protein
MILRHQVHPLMWSHASVRQVYERVETVWLRYEVSTTKHSRPPPGGDACTTLASYRVTVGDEDPQARGTSPAIPLAAGGERLILSILSRLLI